MKSVFYISLLLFIVTSAFAQKKLISTTKSAITEIDLPSGSKQDKRMLSESMAGVLLETESEKSLSKLRTAEVLILPPASVSKFNKDSLLQRLSAQNWKIVSNEGLNYVWIQKNQRFVIAYFSIEKNESNLYFAESVSKPDFNKRNANPSGTQLETKQPNPSLPVPGVVEPQQNKTENNNLSVLGSWGKSNSVSQLNNRFGTYSYNKQQYIFNQNGDYSFLAKNYSEDNSETILIKETGTYIINGKNLTIVPKTSIIETWSKKNGSDNYNKLISSQKRALEKTTYQFTLEGKNLILSFSKETIRDGRFSNGNYYTYGPPETFTAIKVPGQ